jgi:DNA-binding LytR/AlgR family response regulator
MAVEKFYDQKDNLDSENQNVVLSTDYFFVKKNKSLKKVNIREIIYIEVEERFCHLITLKENFIVTLSLKKLVEYLNEDIFAKSHRNFMVNIDRINEINMKDNLIIMEGGHKVQLSDHYKGFVQRYNLL